MRLQTLRDPLARARPPTLKGGVCAKSLLLPPGTVQQLHLSQPLGDHGGEDQPEKHAANQDVIVIVFQNVKLFGRINSGLVDV